MRYSIMLQVVGAITFILVGAGAFFAWIQARPGSGETEGSEPVEQSYLDLAGGRHS